MNPLLVYLLKVNIAIALFLLFYRLLFSGDTFWKARRIYLISSVLIAFAYPVFSLQSWVSESPVLRGLAVEYVELQEFVVTPTAAVVVPWKDILLGIYLAVALLLMIRILIQLTSIVKLKLQSQQLFLQGLTVRKLNGEITPFSFFGTIYLNPDLHSEEETSQILTHELTHVLQWHSLDVVLAELLCVLFWMNPFVWLLRKEIRQNLEYLADDRVVSSGVDSRHYQYHLLRLSCQLPGYQLTNKFNISPLKKRIRMMNQPRSSKTTALKYLLIAPLSFSLVVLSNAEALASSLVELMPATVTELMPASVAEKVTETKAETKVATPELPVKEIIEQKKEEPQKTTKINTVEPVSSDPSKLQELTVVAYPPVETPQKDDDPVFTVVEEMPQFIGGDQALFKYLANSVKYPVAAQQKGIQGRVICQFVVDRDGKVTEPAIVRGVSHELDAEAIRVVQSMPVWKPGMQKGKAVRVKYTLPINFRLQGKADETPATALQKQQPVLVIDGEVKDAGFDLNSIKPEDIEEITVLKSHDDPAQVEKRVKLYGERANEGVIIIKMKK